MGALVTLELADDSPVLNLPWIITFGPLNDDEEWDPVVCGPYERPHALALAEGVVADQDLMAVVEPVVPHLTIDAIRADIEASKAAALEAAEVDLLDEDLIDADLMDLDADLRAQRAGDEFDEPVEEEPMPAPDPEEVRAGLARIAARLAANT